MIRAIWLWNSLPHEVVSSLFLELFKQMLAGHLSMMSLDPPLQILH